MCDCIAKMGKPDGEGRLPRATATVGEDFGNVHSLACGELADLFAATEAVGDNDGHWTSGIHGRKQADVSNCFRDFDFIGFEAERTGHSTAGCVDHADFSAGLA